jgi:hypothetical protein
MLAANLSICAGAGILPHHSKHENGILAILFNALGVILPLFDNNWHSHLKSAKDGLPEEGCFHLAEPAISPLLPRQTT